jgi:hypothetical protein
VGTEESEMNPTEMCLLPLPPALHRAQFSPTNALETGNRISAGSVFCVPYLNYTSLLSGIGNMHSYVVK